MSRFKMNCDLLTSITEIAQDFQNLAGPVLARGDVQGVYNLYRKAYADVMRGRKRGSLEELQVRNAMEQALKEVLTHEARDRSKYFQANRDLWWREREKDGK